MNLQCFSGHRYCNAEFFFNFISVVTAGVKLPKNAGEKFPDFAGLKFLLSGKKIYKRILKFSFRLAKGKGNILQKKIKCVIT